MAQQTFEEWFDENSSRLVWVLELKEALEALKEAYQLGLEQQQQQSQWLPIDTAPLNVEIIVLTNDGDVGTAVLYEEFAKDDLKLWQPLPKPPQN